MAKRIEIRIDMKKYPVQNIRKILDKKFRDEFKFTILEVRGCCYAVDYLLSDFESFFESQRALDRINKVLQDIIFFMKGE